MSMRDAYILRRRQWLRRLSRRYMKNARGIQAEELAHRISDRFAVLVFAIMIVVIILEAAQ